jgi:hypothetical protein
VGFGDLSAWLGCDYRFAGEGVAVSFSRQCIRPPCVNLVPENRLRKGYITCSPECQKEDRKAYMLYRVALRRQRIIGSGWFRKLVKEQAKAYHSVKCVPRGGD